jgi:uncharacterized protein YhaN
VWRTRAAEAARLKAAIDAIGPLRRLEASVAERSAIARVEGLPADAISKHASWLSQHAALESSLRELNESIASLDDTLASTVIDDALLKKGDAISAVARDLAIYLEDLKQRPARATELSLLEQRARETLRTLRPDWELERLRRFQLDVVASSNFDAACEQLEDARQEVEKLTGILRQLDDDLRENDAERAALPAAIDVAPLRAWLDSAPDIAADRKSVQTIESRISTLKKQHSKLLAALDPTPTKGMRAPRLEEVMRFEEERTTLDDERRRAEDRVRTRKQELASLSDEDDVDARVPTEKQLRESRRKRDALLDELLEGKKTAGQVRAHARAVSEADALADAMRAHADVVQRSALLADARERAVAATARAEQELADHLKKLAEHEARWRRAWSIEPRPPSAMRVWLEQRAKLLSLEEDIDSERERVAALTQQIDAWTKRGRELLGLERVEELRVIAAERVAAQDQRTARLQALDRTRARDLGRRKSTADALQASLARVAAIEKGMPQLLSAIGLETDLSPTAARLLIQGLARARAELVSGEASLRAQLARMDDSLKEYRARAAMLAEGEPDVVIPALERALTTAREAARASDRALRARTEQLAKRKRIETKLGEVAANIATLYRTAGVASEPELMAVIADNERYATLTRDIVADERHLAQLCGDLDRETFHALVRAVDPSALPAMQAEAERLHQEMLSHEREVGDARARLSSVDGRSDAAIAQAELEAERATLAQEVERYAVLTLSETLLSQAIDRFERDNQPALLHRASSVFAAMTGGRYVSVRKSGDNLVVERANGDVVQPDVLSTGTREQLYLAIRLAYVEHYCASAEPLPVVLDDVLVNFDDDRAQATLEALASFATTTQVILFTCHRSTRDLAASIGAQTLEIPAS